MALTRFLVDEDKEDSNEKEDAQEEVTSEYGPRIYFCRC